MILPKIQVITTSKYILYIHLFSIFTTHSIPSSKTPLQKSNPLQFGSAKRSQGNQSVVHNHQSQGQVTGNVSYTNNIYESEDKLQSSRKRQTSVNVQKSRNALLKQPRVSTTAMEPLVNGEDSSSSEESERYILIIFYFIYYYIYYYYSSYKERRWRLRDTPAFEQLILPIMEGGLGKPRVSKYLLL
jgi:hypothetical protein